MITIPQRYRRSDGRTDNSWARTRGAQLSTGYTVNTYSISRCALYSWAPCVRSSSRKSARWENQTSRRSIYSADWQTRDRHEAKVTVPSWKLGNSSTYKCAGLKLADRLVYRKTDTAISNACMTKQRNNVLHGLLIADIFYDEERLLYQSSSRVQTPTHCRRCSRTSPRRNTSTYPINQLLRLENARF